MINTVVTAGLKNIVEADDVALNISVRVGDAVTYASLRCKIDYNRRRIFLENPGHRLLPGNAVFHEHEALVLRQPAKPLLLDIDIIIICH